jgi:hypothetical protein
VLASVRDTTSGNGEEEPTLVLDVPAIAFSLSPSLRLVPSTREELSVRNSWEYFYVFCSAFSSCVDLIANIVGDSD